MNKRINYILCSVILFVIFLSGQFLSAFSFATYAKEKILNDETSVLDDLSFDSDFDVLDFPEVDDGKIDVVHIEFLDDVAYLYVYQPDVDVPNMTQVAISRSATTLSFRFYDLTLCNKVGTLAKYALRDDTLIGGFAWRPFVCFISALYRPFDSNIDKAPEDDNTITAVSVPIGQVWEYSEFGNVSMSYLDVIEVEQKHVGTIRYTHINLFGSGVYVDSHYIAFSVNRPIDDLLEADVYYTQKVHQVVDYSYQPDYEYWGDVEKKYVTLYKTDVFAQSTWWDKYKYNRIQTIDEFTTSESDLTSATKEALKGKDWVLRFAETPYSTHREYSTPPGSFIPVGYEEKTEYVLENVTILRLAYEYNGKYYNVGVVDDMQSGDRLPDNKVNEGINNTDVPWWVDFMGVILVILLIALLMPFVLPVIKAIFQILWWVLCAPFKFVKWIIDKVRYKK